MKTYKWYQTALIVSFSLLANVLGRALALFFNLPLWLDCFGTFLTAYVLGPWCGIITGISSNLMNGMIFQMHYAYSLTAIFTALVTGYLSRHGWMKYLLKTTTLGFIVTIVSTSISCILNYLFWNGNHLGNVWGEGICELFAAGGFPHVLCVILGQFYIDFLDKMITLMALFFFIRIYRMSKKYLPASLVLQKFTVFLIIFLALCGKEKLYSQSRNYDSYVHLIYNKETGLPGGKANDIASTNDGILWVGTYEGLYRHNGHEFRLMREFDSIKAVRCLYVDDEGRLFVGTNDNGLTIIINETVMNILEEKDGLPTDSIRSVTRGSNGLYYVGTAEEMAILSIADGLGIYKILPEIEGAIRVSADEHEHVAAVTVSGNIYLISGSEIIWTSSNISEKFTSAAFSPNGLLYASTESNKLFTFVISEGAERKNDIPSLVQTLSCAPLRHINSIDFYDGVIFICADNGTGYIENNSFRMIETGLFNNSIDNMTEDYQGNLWFTSSRQGLLKMCNTSFAEIYSSAGFSEAVVNSVTRFEGNLYFATDDGLTAIDSKTGKPLNNELTSSLSGTRVRCLSVTKNGDMWICTKSRGLIHVDQKKKMTAYGKGHVFRVAIELSDGTIAAGGNDGITFIKDGKILSWIGENYGLENPLILSLCEESDGTVLAGSDGGGLAILNKYEGEWAITRIMKKGDGLSSNVILRTVNDYDGKTATGGFYAILSNGICYLKKENDDYSVKVLSNFPYSNNYDMIIRPNRNIFVLSSAGIFVVNRDDLLSGQKLDYELLDLKKGLRGSFTANAWNYLDEEGNLYLSCDSGSSRINLDYYDRNDHSYRIQLKSILVDGKRHIVQKDTPFVIPPESDKVEILPEIINFSIQNPFVSVYMEGVDEKPSIMLQNELSSLIYTNLKAGSYNLHISILDSKGLMATEESVFRITKSYNFYDNWWFMLYAVGVFVLMVAWLTWFITSTLLRRRMEKQAHQMEEIQKQVRIGNETIFSIANAVEARDMSTGRHSFRVAEYSVMIARELGFSQEELDALHKTGLLHDIGKIGVPDSILNKPAKLTDEEYRVMKNHVNIGGEILKDFSLIKNVADGAMYHHERYDGTGYPNGLKGEEIPLNARIIGIADAFDAMTANRVYRNALSLDYVIGELKRLAGKQFDPGLVEIMLELIDKGMINVHKTVEESTNKEAEDEK